MMRAVVVDDEPHICSALVALITAHCPGVEVAGTAGSVAAAIDLIAAAAPDIVFLDIEMPERNGFELLATFPVVPFKVIVVTAYDRYALRAIKLSALDYLLKPVHPLELQAAVAKAVAASVPVNSVQVELMADHTHGRPHTKVVVPTAQGFIVIAMADIVRCRSQSNYTYLHLTDGTHVVSSRTLGDYEELLLDARFCRVHHSHLVNLDHVRGYRSGKGGVAIMSDGAEVEVSMRRREVFLERIRKI